MIDRMRLGRILVVRPDLAIYKKAHVILVNLFVNFAHAQDLARIVPRDTGRLKTMKLQQCNEFILVVIGIKVSKQKILAEFVKAEFLRRPDAGRPDPICHAPKDP